MTNKTRFRYCGKQYTSLYGKRGLYTMLKNTYGDSATLRKFTSFIRVLLDGAEIRLPLIENGNVVIVQRIPQAFC